ncbi:MAG: ABC transporter permease [Deltaproteobacteria bacterium]|jgi:peptide/nickel transport system permease protein|nr:ABC transporter permease [Deltaproteobacteria bacterium]
MSAHPSPDRTDRTDLTDGPARTAPLDPPDLPSPPRKKRGQWASAARRFKKDRLAVAGVVMLIVMIAAAVAAGFFVDYERDVVRQNVLEKLRPPGPGHWLGTDQYGRDILARLLYGARYSLSIGATAIVFALGGGLVVGATAGYFGGLAENVLMRLVDMFIAIPATLFAIAVVSALGPGVVNLTMAIAMAYLPIFARIMRAATLTVKDLDHVEAARAIGCGHLRILVRHVLPSIMGPLIVQGTLGVGYAILQASALSFLGLGVMPPDPEWGAMLSEGGAFMRQSPWMVIFAGLAIIYVILALNIIGDGLRDALDPKMRD